MSLDDKTIVDVLSNGNFAIEPSGDGRLLRLFFAKESSPFLIIMNMANRQGEGTWSLRNGYFKPNHGRHGRRITPVFRSISVPELDTFLGNAWFRCTRDPEQRLTIALLNDTHPYSLVLPLTVIGEDSVMRLHEENTIALNAVVPAYVSKHLGQLSCDLDPLQTKLDMIFSANDLRALAVKMAVQLYIEANFPKMPMSCSEREISLETSASQIRQLLADLKEQEGSLMPAIDAMLAEVEAAHKAEAAIRSKRDRSP